MWRLCADGSFHLEFLCAGAQIRAMNIHDQE